MGFGVPCQFSADYLCVALNILNNVGGKTGYIERLTEPFSLLVAALHPIIVIVCLSYVLDIFTRKYPDRTSADINVGAARRLFLASPCSDNVCQVGALRMMPNVWILWFPKIAVLLVIDDSPVDGMGDFQTNLGPMSSTQASNFAVMSSGDGLKPPLPLPSFYLPFLGTSTGPRMHKVQSLISGWPSIHDYNSIVNMYNNYINHNIYTYIYIYMIYIYIYIANRM